MFTLILDLIFPPRCASCNSFGVYLCDKCYEKMYWYSTPQHIDIDHPKLDELYACTTYKHSGKDIVKKIKFRGIYSQVYTMSQLMSTLPKTDIDFLSFAPLHAIRERERGFNQAEILARQLGKLWDLPVSPTLQKIRHTSPQAELDRKDRLNHLTNAFTYSSTIDITSKTIGIVDDVATTGTTLNECAKVLKIHGAKKVIGLVFAHGK